ncbi:hypothetical protein DCC85_22610 [Paenibacillus sp. CAA11]|uniref:hypothetical protein n=1 Tax=Paenibacillus sp. CAA11 TaxID=1532905 RepID=UPI000D38E3F8|nr:hypothetical protein [Paenibacillus sp. CAA11]AWB46687.1 hypothetical protein DCC85_22610 [Paenibacillus sp. CAA11]
MRWMTRIMSLVLVTVLVCGLSMLTTGMVVNAYVQSLLTSLNIKWEGQPTGLASLLGLSAGSSSKNSKADAEEGQAGQNQETERNNSAAGTTASNLEAADKKQDKDTSLPAGQEQVNPGKGDKEEEAPEDSIAVMGKESKKEAEDAPVVSSDELQATKEGLSAEAKAEIFQLLMKKLPEQEVQSLTAAMEGGLTEEEMIQAQQVLSKYLSKEEYAKVMNMLK